MLVDVLLLFLFVCFIFFFFQAEDGIRDWSVTGVQTCALPIYGDERLLCKDGRHESVRVFGPRERSRVMFHDPLRSEERRVGKECRSRWWQYDYKKKEEINV